MKMKIITFKIDQDTLERLDKIAEKLQQPRSVLIRQGIFDIIEKKEKELRLYNKRIRIIKD